MPSATLTREILSRALALKTGEKITIKAGTYLEMEATRTALIKEKNLQENAGLSFSGLTISRFSSKKQEKYFVILYKPLGPSNITLTRADGTTENLDICDSEDSEIQRICKLMEEDGATPEDIQQMKSSWKGGVRDDNADSNNHLQDS